MKPRRLNRGAAPAPPPAPPPSPPPAAPGAPGAPRSNRVRVLVGAAVLAVAAVAVAVAYWPHKEPPETPPPNPGATAVPPTGPAPLPPLSSSPFHNTRPGVAFVGDRKCLECHDDMASYHGHPMGRSLFRAPEAPPLERFGAGLAFQSGPFRFRVWRDGNRQIHREWCEDARGNVVAEQEVEVAYAIGAGSQGRSYLYQRDGFLFESPITWYVEKGKWDLSPGYDKNPAHFTRRIGPKCLFCHAHESRPVEHSTNRYRDPPFGQLAVGCERCHGPGALHVDASRPAVPLGDVDYTIVNPRRLTPALRDAVCEQCHLQGEGVIPRRGRSLEDFRPGLPLHEFAAIFVRPPELEEPTAIVGHAEQMRQSACHARSAGRFDCTSCHDPHRAPAPAEAVGYFEGKCRDCHGAAKPKEGKVAASDCSLPPGKRVAKDGRRDCLACHMPRNPSATNQHLAVTDHRILREPGQVRPRASGFRPGDIPLLPYHQKLLPPGDPELPRDLAIAAVDLAGRFRRGGPTPDSDFLMRRSLAILDGAVARDPHDLPALEARGWALFDQGDFAEALRMFEAVLAKAPEREQSLAWATEAALNLGRLDAAEAHGRRLVEKYPHFPLHRERLAVILAKRKAWPDALAVAREAVRGNPFRAQSRELLIHALVETGDVAKARSELDALGVIDPAHQARLRQQLADRLK